MQILRNLVLIVMCGLFLILIGCSEKPTDDGTMGNDSSKGEQKGP